jgi:hypothetical protein
MENNRFYKYPNDSTLYDIRKIGKLYYRFHENIENNGSITWHNCGIGYKTKKESLIGLVLA